MPCDAATRQPAYGAMKTTGVTTQATLERRNGATRDIADPSLTPARHSKPNRNPVGFRQRPTSINLPSAWNEVPSKPTLEHVMSAKRQSSVQGDFHAENSDETASTDHEAEQKSSPREQEAEKPGREHSGSLPTVKEELTSTPPSPSSRNKPMARSFSSFDLPAGGGRMKRGGRTSLQLAFTQTVKLFKTVRRGSKSTPGTPMHKSASFQSWDDTSSWAGGSVAERPEANGSYYKSYEDLTIGSTPLGSPSSTHGLSPQSRAASYTGDIWCVVGRSGGTVRVPGTDVSLHINAHSPNGGCACGNPSSTAAKPRERSGSVTGARFEKKRSSSRKKRTTSSSTTSAYPSNAPDLSCPGPADFDGRIVLGLEDPPDIETLLQARYIQLEPQQIAHAGPAVRLDFVDDQLCDHEITIQLSTNLKTTSPKFADDVDDTEGANAFVMTCLQSDILGYSYREVKTCFQFGDTLQATLDLRREIIRDSDIYYRVCVVPIIKVLKFPVFTPWSFVTLKSFGVGVYGPERVKSDSFCCLSISPTGFSPPTLDLTHETTYIQLRRWSSFSLPIQEMQDFDVHVQAPQLSTLSATLISAADCILSYEDACTSVRRDYNFLIRIKTDCVELGSVTQANSTITLKLTGKEDRRVRKIKCEVPVMASKPPSASPRLKKRDEGCANDFAFQWHIFQLENKSELDWSGVPGASRTICPISLAIAQRQRNDKRSRQGQSNPYLLCYDQADYLVVISDKTLLVNDRERKIECLLVYTQHKIGLVQTNHMREIDFNEFYNWSKARPTAKSVIDAITEPVQHFNYSFPRIQKKLLESDIAWSVVIKSIKFGATFVSKANHEQTPKNTRKDMMAYFLSKYKEYCSEGPRRRSFCQEITKALLFAEEYEVAVELLTDCCLFTVALAIANRWPALATNLTNTTYEPETPTKIIDKLDPWKGAWTFLSAWRKDMENDHTTLVKLHNALDDMLDFPRKALSCVTASIILVSSIDCLRCYDTRL